MMFSWLKSLFPNVRDAAIRWSEDDASSLAASVAYYLALSLFPLMLLLFSGLGLFLQFTHLGKNVEQQFLTAVSTYGSPLIEKLFHDILAQLRTQSVVTGPSGLIASIMAAIGVFCALDRGLDRIWRIPPRKEKTLRGTVKRLIKDRFWAFVMLISLGGMMAMLFAANMVLAQVRSIAGTSLPSLVHVLGVFDFCCTIFANAILFAMAYRWLPRKPVRWQEAFRGGLLAAGVWELGRIIMGMFLIGMSYTSAYGAIGSFIGILLWFYYGVSIFFFGAEYVQVLQLKKGAKKDAVRLENQGIQLSVVESVPADNLLAPFEESTVPPSPSVRQKPRRSLDLKRAA